MSCNGKCCDCEVCPEVVVEGETEMTEKCEDPDCVCNVEEDENDEVLDFCDDPECGCHEVEGEFLPDPTQEELVEFAEDFVGTCADDIDVDEVEDSEDEAMLDEHDDWVFPWAPVLYEEEILIARDMFAVKALRNPLSTDGEECTYDQHYETACNRIKNMIVEYDGNMTLVTISTDDGPVVGWAKFNPEDENTFDRQKGFYKATDRAICKMLGLL